MIEIKKEKAPEDLVKLQQKAIERNLTPKKAYDTLKGKTKKEVRNKLVKEQGELCAYCMCKIPRKQVDSGIDPISIEHIIPRNLASGKNVGQGLDYNNLVAVCHGNKAKHGIRKISDHTCDVSKGDSVFKKVNPCNPSTLTSIFYHSDGRIDAKDPDVKDDLVRLLNLNCNTSSLVNERKATLDALLYEIENEIEYDDQILSCCRKKLADFERETCPKTPYVGIILWYLKDILRNDRNEFE